MNFLKRFFTFGWLVAYFQSGRAERDLKAARDLMPKALPIVEEFARWTPTRADDELIALFRKYAIPGIETFLAMPVEKRGLALLDGASYVLSLTFPGTAARVLNAAVQLAYTAWRAEQEG